MCLKICQGLPDGGIALLQLGLAYSQGRQQVDDMAQGSQIDTLCQALALQLPAEALEVTGLVHDQIEGGNATYTSEFFQAGMVAQRF
jgi:hypothetical protein